MGYCHGERQLCGCTCGLTRAVEETQWLGERVITTCRRGDSDASVYVCVCVCVCVCVLPPAGRVVWVSYNVQSGRHSDVGELVITPSNSGDTMVWVNVLLPSAEEETQ